MDTNKSAAKMLLRCTKISSMFLFFTFYLLELYSKQVVLQDRKRDAIFFVIVITSHEIYKQFMQSMKTESVKAFGLGFGVVILCLPLTLPSASEN